MLSHLLNNIDIGVLEFDNKLKCIYMNEYMIKNFEINDMSLVNDKYILNNYENHVHKDDVESNRYLAEEFFKNRTNSENICRIKNIMYKEYHWYKIKRIYKDTYIYTFEDINNLKLLEIELREAKVKVESSYNHKNLFFANINHELRTPLNGIIGMLTLLEDTKLDNEQQDYLEMTRECSVSLMSIINDILDYSKLEAGKLKLDFQPMNLRQCIESTSDIIISKLYEKNVEYTYNIDPILNFDIYGDQNRLKQVLSNLLSNSIKFTEKGKIVLDVSIMQDDSNDDSNNDSNDIFIKFSVIDTGCGIAFNDRDKLFKSFSQLENLSSTKLYKGTGLGLAICKELVTLMSGRIWIDWSVIGEGSRFCFTIKTHKTDNNNSQNIPTETYDSNILHGKTIFILDDKRENRMSLANMVQKWGMKATTYSDASEALYFLKNTNYDLGISDVQMPYMDGREFAINLKNQNIKLNRTEIPLIALSSLGEHFNDLNDLFKAHMIKPPKESKLQKLCSDILAQYKYKYKKEETSNLHNYLNQNDLNNGIKENIRILLVEDVLINQKVVSSFLIKMGFKNIDIADNGKECLEKLTRNKYDIILLDIRMPVLNGEYVIKYIIDYYNKKGSKGSKEYRLLNPRKPYTIAVTAYCLQEDKNKYLAMGFDNYIAKPVNINELNTCMNIFIENLLQN